jgi:hypothetical protein
MAIFLTRDSKVIVQGMTGSEGMKHTTRMLASGTQVVGGVNPRKAGTTVDFPGGVPVFGTVAEAIDATGADVSVVFVPPAFTKAAVVEAVDAGSRSRRHHRGCPGQGHGRVLHLRAGRGYDPAHRPELPRPDQLPASPTPASSRPTSPVPAGSAWSPSRGR